MQLVEFDEVGKRDGPFGRTIDFLGDGAIRLIFTPGHTHGHQSVMLRLDDGRTVLLVGDAATQCAASASGGSRCGTQTTRAH